MSKKKFKAVCNICGEKLVSKKRRQWSRSHMGVEEWEYIELKCPNDHGVINVY